ncbi:glycosyltransferase family 9 protein [Acanthopleuribacter pedis]|uniref:Glycosyltransferase family 9 protein n=1 Tax=Acanthopleuribacter pedis TaxID=442870 RepID=A0A8J7QCN3_9BACT|nr:glycosyltransferase family 9 protein [Acanthopleuribacter pedis]MBO1317120.1 glycosyltransferase family 9 protein [Acanthopleuribacter pedis]
MKHVLLSRTDNLGDVMLTLPMAKALKSVHPHCRIWFLGKTYTRALVEACASVDGFVNWDDLRQQPADEQRRFLRALDLDTVFHVFPNREVAKVMKAAGIRDRVGTSHRLWHWWTCNRLLFYSRKRSDHHEAQLNLMMLQRHGVPFYERDQIAALYDLADFVPLPEHLAKLIDPNRFNLVLHPKSKGSARDWHATKFRALCETLPRERFNIFVTGTSAEGDAVRADFLSHCPWVHDVTGRMNLDELFAFLVAADGLVAASTGPLHMCAAAGRHALGLFAPMRPIHPGRWAPLGPKAEVLVADKDCNACRKQTSCPCIADLAVAQVAARVTAWADTALESMKKA